MSLLKKEIKAFGFALQGIKSFLIKEDHGKVHLLATLVIVPLIFTLPTTAFEKAAVFIVIALVWAMEMCNSAVEKTLDIIIPQKRKEVAYIKDVMAGAVLIASVSSVAIGIIIILPKFCEYVL